MLQATGGGSRATINRNIRTRPWAIYMNLLRVPDDSLKAEALRLSSNRTREQLLQAIERSFEIDDYLELRKRFPDQDTACWMVMANDKASPCWGMDFAFQLETDFEKFGISIHGFLGTLDGAPEEIDRFALEILAAISDRERTAVAIFMAENPDWSFRQVANATGLNVSTISRWAADSDFVRYVEVFRQGPLKLQKD